MRIVHVPFTYFPDPVGGTEVYVRSLVREQQSLAHSVVIAAPDSMEREYEWAGVPVKRFGVSQALTLPQLYGEGDPMAAGNFGRILDLVKPDVVHLHARTSAISLLLIKEAKRRGISVVFTYHTPTVTCLRGTLLQSGRRVCDGKVDASTCAACMFQSRGVPGWFAPAVVWLLRNGATRNDFIRTGKLATLTQMPALADTHERMVLETLHAADHVVAVCDWVKNVLIRNGVERSRISLNRQGLPDTCCSERTKAVGQNGSVRFAFFGRLSGTKGILLFAHALRATKVAVSLDVYGIAQDAEGEAIRRKLLALAAVDARLSIKDQVAPADVQQTLGEYDCLVVPSQWLETGPLVVYEAFAARVPVLGSDLGGIRELVRHGVDGYLVQHDSELAWRTAIEMIAAQPSLLARMSANISGVRTMRDAAHEMEPIYSKCVRCAAA